MQKNSAKVYVDVLAVFDTDGRIMPLKLRWIDGTSYMIDKVLDVRPTPSLKAGGQGDRYTIRIQGKERYMFLEHDADLTSNKLRWFVGR